MRDAACRIRDDVTTGLARLGATSTRRSRASRGSGRARAASTSPTSRRSPSGCRRAGAMLNLSVDRYRFAVGLGAALLRGHTSLLPPNHIADTVAAPARALRRRLRARRRAGADDHGAADACRHAVRAQRRRARGSTASRRSIPTWSSRSVLTSGSTGAAGAARQALGPARRATRAPKRRGSPRRSAAPTSPASPLVATVPPQHMYGFESTRPARAARRRGPRRRAAVLSGRHRRRARAAAARRACW